MPSITPTISAILPELVEISFMVCTTSTPRDRPVRQPQTRSWPALGLIRVIGVLAHRAGQLLHARRGFLNEAACCSVRLLSPCCP